MDTSTTITREIAANKPNLAKSSNIRTKVDFEEVASSCHFNDSVIVLNRVAFEPKSPALRADLPNH